MPECRSGPVAIGKKMQLIGQAACQLRCWPKVGICVKVESFSPERCFRSLMVSNRLRLTRLAGLNLLLCQCIPDLDIIVFKEGLMNVPRMGLANVPACFQSDSNPFWPI